MSRLVAVEVSDQRLQLDEESIRNCIAHLDEYADFTVASGTLSVAFVIPGECRRLHQTFFGDPDITDVMTFPGDPGDDHAGDLAICPQVAAAACLETGLSFSAELSLYLVHAWLHLAGLDDREDASRKEMRRAESLVMEKLALDNALLSCSWTH